MSKREKKKKIDVEANSIFVDKLCDGKQNFTTYNFNSDLPQ